MTDFAAILETALNARAALIAELEPETDCYRLFHGATEGRPGLAVDRYGPQLLVQTWQELLEEAELNQIVAVFSSVFPDEPLVVYNHRGEGRPPAFHYPTQEALAPAVCTELGVFHRVLGRHKGQDPLLFLDFRVARRWLKENAAGKSVLNTFAYTCGAGVAAAVGGASEVWNVDFARFATDVGAENAVLNGMEARVTTLGSGGRPQDERVGSDAQVDSLVDNAASRPPADFRILVENFFPIIWQLGGQKLKGRAARRRKYISVPRKSFDVIVLDPPRWARTPWGAVDVVRDYQSLFKPCLYAASPEGTILCTNHVPGISLEDWVGDLERCAEKAERPLAGVEILEPEPDFPSPDGQHPLKIALARLAA